MCLHVHRLGLLAFGLWPVQSMRSLKFKFKIDNKTRQTRQTNLWFGLGLCVCASDNVASRQPTIRLQACLQCNVQDLKTMEQLLQRILYQVDSKETHRPIKKLSLKGKNRVGVVWLCAWEHKKSDSSLRSHVSCKLHSVHCKAIA